MVSWVGYPVVADLGHGSPPRVPGKTSNSLVTAMTINARGCKRRLLDSGGRGLGQLGWIPWLLILVMAVRRRSRGRRSNSLVTAMTINARGCKRRLLDSGGRGLGQLGWVPCCR